MTIINPHGIISSKSKVVNNLKKLAKSVDEIIIATDQDREGDEDIT